MCLLLPKDWTPLSKAKTQLVSNAISSYALEATLLNAVYSASLNILTVEELMKRYANDV